MHNIARFALLALIACCLKPLVVGAQSDATALEAQTDSASWEWSSSALPGQTFGSRSAAEQATWALGPTFSLATQVRRSSITPSEARYWYSAPPRDLIYYPWRDFCIHHAQNCPHVSVEAAIDDAADHLTNPPCSFTGIEPETDWIPVPHQYCIGNNCAALRNYRGSWTVIPTCWSTSGPMQAWRFRDVHCPEFFTYAALPRHECILENVFTITGEPMVCGPTVGNPCNIATGDKIQSEVDLALPWISFSRHYHSMSRLPGELFGVGWTHDFNRQLALNGSTPTALIGSDGNQNPLVHVGNQVYESVTDTRIVVSSASPNWTVKLSDGTVEVYGANGRLLNTTRDGHMLSFTYDAGGRLRSITDAKGYELELEYPPGAFSFVHALLVDGETMVSYEYDSIGRLEAATFNGNNQKLYHYEDNSFPYHLTGITDEEGVRYSTYAYDSLGRVASSEHAGGVGLHTFDFLPDGSTQVTSPLGAVSTHRFTTGPLYRKRIEHEDDAGRTEWFYEPAASNARRRLIAINDANDSLTEFSYSEATGPNGPERREVETNASQTPDQRTIETTWSVLSGRVTKVVDGLQATEFTYNTRNQLQARKITDPVTGLVRETSYVYCEEADVSAPNSSCPLLGLAKATDGPRTDVSDVTQFTYYPTSDESGCEVGGACHRRGDLWKTINALGQATENLRYDRAGRLVRQRAVDNSLTDFEYHPRGWLVRRIVRARDDGVPDAADAITQFDYTPTGLAERITQADGDYVDFSYDDAHRLDGVSDALGNSIVYTLDPAGNRIREEVSDDGNVLRRRLAREHDLLGRMVRERDALVDAANPNGRLVAEHGYDGKANRTHTIDGLGHQTDHEYDPLDRLKRSLDALSPRGTTQFDYDARDNLIKVTDPKGLLTEYVYDGLGDLRELRSPDTGTTVYAYDAAGNRVQQTDARGVVTQYDYDALNRLTTIRYPANIAFNVSFAHDQSHPECGLNGVHGSGRLTQATDPSGITLFCHDHRGNVTRRFWQDGIGAPLVTEYRYTRGDRLESITYPSGREVEWVRDIGGRIVTVRSRPDTTATWHTVVSSVAYYPFGPIAGLDFGNGRSLAKTYDANYAIAAVASSHGDGLGLGFQVDVLGQIRSIAPSSGAAGDAERHYDYDPMGRLIDVHDGNQVLIEGYAYDATGNRTQKQTDAGTVIYTYPATSHRLSSAGFDYRLYDPAGNLTSLAQDRNNSTFEYGPNNRYGRLVLNQATAADYTHNGLGERSCKWVAGQPTRYVYGPGGRLLGEYDGNDKVIAEYVYLDDLPVAAFIGSRTVLIETDHLGTPRALADYDTNEVLWRWPLTGSAFGEHPADEDPDANGKPLIFPLRFPGQYLDAESGLHYNYFRDYEPGTGRYVQSDPIGLKDGPSTFSYVWGAPLGYFDVWGLYRICYSNSRPRMVHEIGHGRVPWGWEPYQGFECIPLPEPCPPLDCGDDGYPRECEAEARRCRDRWGKGTTAVSIAGTVVGLTPVGWVAKLCAGGVSISASLAGGFTGHCDDAERVCRERCTRQCR